MSICITTIEDEMIKISKVNLGNNGTYFNLFYLNSMNHSSVTFKGLKNQDQIFDILRYLSEIKIISINLNSILDIKNQIISNLSNGEDKVEYIELST